MKRVLIIDDHCLDENEREAIHEGFAGTDIDYFLCQNADEGRKHIRSGAIFDCIVLDWFLEDQDSSLSQLILKELEGKYYAPVLIYSSQVVNFREEQRNGVISYPENLIREVEKDDFKQLRTEVVRWLEEDTTARLASIYLHKVNECLHKTFWGLNDIPHGNIGAVYKHLVFEKGGIDWGNDFIINLLLQGLIADDEFRNAVIRLVQDIQAKDLQTTAEDKRRILNKILYFHSNSEFVNSADIIKISHDEKTTYGIVVSANCDLVQSKTKYIDYIELREINDSIAKEANLGSIRQNKSESHYTFMSVGANDNDLVDLTAVLKSRGRLVSCDNDGEKYPSTLQRIAYDGRFTLGGADCVVEYVCSLLNPYKSEFAQKRASHDSRVGIPAIFDFALKA